MEAALLQVYAPRDPLAEAIRGEISVRQLRVMVEHLPPGSAYHRARLGPWGDPERLLHDINSRLRDLLAQSAFQSGVLRAAHRVQGTPSDPTYIVEPSLQQAEHDEVELIRSQAEADGLEAVLNRA